ncbi:DUF4440 domain-containing protein [Parvularcula marina]|uniref:YybH family protein n=1 Tax=Parvularcula marina TaxID=2292771 RepID=UPI0035188E61
MLRQLTFLLLLPILAACSGEAETARPDFRTAVETHLGAVAGRDLETLKSTLTLTDGDLQVIFPGGEEVTGVSNVVAFHKEWFADDQWVWTPQIIRIVEGEDLSMALTRYQYRDTPDGAPRERWLLLVFRLEDGAWRLVHDQNTLYPEEVAE